MTGKTTHDTIGALAVATPEAVSVFMRRGIDFCCGGQRTLEAACAEAGLEADLIRAEIIEASVRVGQCAREAWHAMGMTELADHIERVHHARARDLIARIDALLPLVLAAHAGSHPELEEVASTFGRFREELIDHMVREERVLFPWLRRLDAPSSVHIGPPWSVARPISCMVHDHEDAAAALASIRGDLQNYAIPVEACGSYTALITTLKALDEDTRTHIHKENNALFPAGVRAEAERGARDRASGEASPQGLDALHSAG